MNRKNLIKMLVVFFGILTLAIGALVIIKPTQIRVIANITVFVLLNISLVLKHKYNLEDKRGALLYLALSIFLLIPLFLHIKVYLMG